MTILVSLIVWLIVQFCVQQKMKLFCTFGLMAVAIILATCSALPAHNKLGDVIMENEQRSKY